MQAHVRLHRPRIRRSECAGGWETGRRRPRRRPHARAAGHYWGDTFGLATALAWGPTPAEDALQTLGELGATAGEPEPRVPPRRARPIRGSVGPRAGRRRALRAEWRPPALRFLADLAALEGDYETAASYGTLASKRGRPPITSPLWRRTAPSSGAGSAWRVARTRPSRWSTSRERSKGRSANGSGGRCRRASSRTRRARGGGGVGTRGDRCPRAHRRTDVAGRRLPGPGRRVAAGRIDEAVEAFEQALERYGRKQNLAMVTQVRQSSKRRAATRTAVSAREDRPPMSVLS